MIVLLAKYYVKEGNMDAVLAAFAEAVPLVLANEPECSRYEISRAVEDPNLILINERYADMAAVDFHRATPHFKEIVQGRIWPLLDNRVPEFFETVIA
ncbi:MAG TPA: putative quinol monooxygenase [Thermomicrobiales bacterium]|nr:putative quinol monooxygenase [Thermomicrobiales bacterium]